MLLGGLWHGAQWQFVVWGAFHGVLLALERAFSELTGRRSRPEREHHPARVARVFLTFMLVLIGWVFFRAQNLTHATTFLGCMFGLVTPTLGSTLAWGMVIGDFGLAVLTLCALATWAMPRTEEWVSRAWDSGQTTWRPHAIRVATLLLFGLSLLEMSVQSHNPFLYFQF